FLKLLGSGREFNCKFTFEVQEDALGIAHALNLAKDFVDGEDCAVVLGDNIFEDNLAGSVNEFRSGAHIFLKEIEDASRFGVAEIKGNKVIGIEEKPANPKTNLAVTGFYIYDNTVFDIIKNIKPSGRGELEITDVNNEYIRLNKMTYTSLQGHWTDSGTFESLFRANRIARDISISGKTTPFEALIKKRNEQRV
ncbi:MAG: sugar phosphate nucleotidyltransferase, partial [Candidatus Gracilibacteria bacterium]